MVRRPLAYKDAALFFLPLIFMSNLMMVSHSVVHAFLARLPEPKIALAAFSIAFSIQTMMAGFIGVLTLASISFVNARKPFHRLVRFGWSASLFTTGVTLAIALTPFGDLVYGTILGAGVEVTRQAKEASMVFAFILPVVVLRQVSNGLIMVNRKTALITCASAVRLVTLALFLIFTPRLLPRAVAGAVALLLCISMETLFVLLMARPFYRDLPAREGEPPSYPEIWRFTWPLMLNQMGENGLTVTINFFLGRLLRADLALAAFGVVRGLVMLMSSPLRNLAQTAQALVKSAEDQRVMLRFAGVVVLIFSGIMVLLFYTPMRAVVLNHVMGLNPELSETVAPAMMAAVAVPALWGAAAVMRGLIIAGRKTRRLAASAGARLTAVVAVASITLWWPDVNGAVVGACALMGALGTEGLLLAWWLVSGTTPTPTPPDAPLAEAHHPGRAG